MIHIKDLRACKVDGTYATYSLNQTPILFGMCFGEDQKANIIKRHV